ncbi:MAG: redoxin domain-containing protein [Promethearchaeota archaeon]
MEKKDLKEGDRPPIFKLESYNAGTIDLAQLIGKQKIVLIFSRYFGCPICQLDLKILLERKDEIERTGAKIIYITQSGEKVSKEFIEKEKIDFPVIPSSKDELYARYDLGIMTNEAVKQIPSKIKDIRKYGITHGEYEGWEKQGPGQFVINEQGVIIQALKGWLDVDSLLSIL